MMKIAVRTRSRLLLPTAVTASIICCRATGDIGVFTIVSEGGVAAGIRRVEAVTGEGAVALLQDERRQLQAVSSELHVTPNPIAVQV